MATKAQRKVWRERKRRQRQAKAGQTNGEAKAKIEGDVSGDTAVPDTPAEVTPPDWFVLREYEARQAQKMRGYCMICGHLWRPRNPSPKVNRCPGCGVRGSVSLEVVA